MADAWDAPDAARDAPLPRAMREFRERFGCAPALAADAPGRVNLIGEHTDYNGGWVLPMAIDRRTVIVAAPNDADCSTLISMDAGEVIEVDLTGALTPSPGRFPTHVLGVVDQFRRRGLDVPNLDLVISSNVPIGAGLSSSAALEVAMATLLEQVCGVALEPMEKATLCQQAEHEYGGTPCGLMDLLAAVHGIVGHALLIDCRDSRITPVPLPPPNHVAILIADTGIKHELARGEYARRRTGCETATRMLGLTSLREAANGPTDLSVLREPLNRFVEHVVAENERTLVVAAAIKTGDLAALGEFMFQSHESLRDLYQVSCAELDCLVEAAAELRESGGVIGARMTGGGFGGCAVVVCGRGAVQRVVTHLRRRFADRFNRDPIIFEVRADAGAALLRLDR
jgi:galactokinase